MDLGRKRSANGGGDFFDRSVVRTVRSYIIIIKNNSK
jgi:hypothetical protein